MIKPEDLLNNLEERKEALRLAEQAKLEDEFAKFYSYKFKNSCELAIKNCWTGFRTFDNFANKNKADFYKEQLELKGWKVKVGTYGSEYCLECEPDLTKNTVTEEETVLEEKPKKASWLDRLKYKFFKALHA